MGNRLSRKKIPREPYYPEEGHGILCGCDKCCELNRRSAPDNPFGSYSEDLCLKGIRIEMKPTTFKISTDPGKPSKFTFTNNQLVEQDIVLNCYSQIFAIQSPTGKRRFQSQYFVQLKPNESLNVEIGLRDSKDLPPFPARFDADSRLYGDFGVFSAAGYVEIAHYPHTRENPFKFDGVYRYDRTCGDYYGMWRDYLVPDKETEWVKEKCKEFEENVLNAMIARGDHWDLEKNQKSGKGKAPPNKKEEPPKKSVKSEIKKSGKKEVVSSKKEEPKEKEKSAGKKSKKSKSSEVKKVEKEENSKSNIIV